MNNLTKRLFTTSIILATVAGLTACSSTQKTTRITNEKITPNTEQVATTDRTTTGNTVTEQPVSRQVQGGQDLRALKPGEPVQYYARQFDILGYKVLDVKKETDRVTYDLGRGTETDRVVLIQPPGSTKVQRIESKANNNVATTATGNTANDPFAQKLSREIQQIPTGKKPGDYIPQLSKLGTVSDYSLHKDYATVKLHANNKDYKVKMDIDPNKNVVTDLKLDKNLWEIPS